MFKATKQSILGAISLLKRIPPYDFFNSTALSSPFCLKFQPIRTYPYPPRFFASEVQKKRCFFIMRMAEYIPGMYVAII